MQKLKMTNQSHYQDQAPIINPLNSKAKKLNLMLIVTFHTLEENSILKIMLIDLECRSYLGNLRI